MDKVLIEQPRLESQAGRGFQTLLKSIFKKVWIEEKDSHIFAHTKQQQNFNHMNNRFTIEEFPTCLHRNLNLKKEIIGDISNAHDCVFSFNGSKLLSVRGYGTSFSPDSRNASVFLTVENAKLLKQAGINIEPAMQKSSLLMDQQDWNEYRSVCAEFYAK